ncbi:flavodoxin family protein [Bacteroidota bacterium]
MRITIYNANDSEEDLVLERRVAELSEILGDRHDIEAVKLNNLDLKFCNGCWACWVKTPGRCVVKDDMAKIHQSFISSDLVIFAAPMRMGFPGSLMKKVTDRLIPLVHPYIELVNDECHHVPRYDNYPSWGLILEEEEQGTQADLDLVREIYERTALNIKSSLLFSYSSSSTAIEIADEIDHI